MTMRNVRTSEEFTIKLPDDWHQHFRDGAKLRAIAPLVCKQFGRAIAMPNLKPPVVTTERALAYREEILQALPAGSTFEPLMTLYLTDNTTPEEIRRAKESGKVVACKLYPAGATTNSESGVTDINKVKPTLEEMARQGILLLVHGEVTDQHVDIFDREAEFIEQKLKPLIRDIPSLKVVMEHITTKEAAEFVQNGPDTLAATITAHHLLENRNAIFKGGLRPHMYCLPVLKREKHRQALLAAIRSGSPKFFLGTDSAAHAQNAKQSDCGCAGVFTAHVALELYAQAFEEADALEHFENFASVNGPRFYGLPENTRTITLLRKPQEVVKAVGFGDPPHDASDTIIPFKAGETIPYSLKL